MGPPVEGTHSVTDIEDSAGAAEVDEEREAGLAKAALESLAAERRLAELVSPEAVDRMLGDAEAAGVAVDGPGGLLGQITRAVLERALGAELDDHLGYVKGDLAGNGSGNSRATRRPQRRPSSPTERVVPPGAPYLRRQEDQELIASVQGR
jgi:hypothetical protein